MINGEGITYIDFESAVIPISIEGQIFHGS